MHRLVRLSNLTLGLLLVLVSATLAGTPQQFQVQGVLRDGSSNVVADGDYALILTGWDDSTGGTLLWTENKVVHTTQGLFQTMLSGAAPAALLSHSGQQYMQVQVSGQAPLVPRVILGSVPSALLSTRMDGDVVTQPGEMVVLPPGDPDFDLLRITAVDSTASIAMGGDPDFDLLRISAGNTGTSVVVHGDPDFDLLRITGVDSTSSVTIGDPDFDLLRMTASPTGASLVVHGDPDFDLLRITAVDSTATLSLTGDPDFDLLRLTTNPQGSSIHMGGDPDFDLLRMTAVNTTASLSLTGDPDFDLLRITANDTAASIRMSGDPDFDLLRITAGSTVAGLAIGDPGVNGVTMSNDVDGDGVAGPSGIAIDEAGVHVVRIESGSGGGGGGHGGGSIAVNEDGTHNVSISADSASGSIDVADLGGRRAVLTVDSTGSRYNFFEGWPCGKGNVEIGSDGLAFRCTPGGSVAHTTVIIDPDGNMHLDGSLSVGGNICAVGTIGACSDARYKTDITTLQGALAQIGRIRGVNFNWRTAEFPDKHFRTDRDLGFIAQELKEVVPQVVTLGKDGYYSVDYGRLTPLLVEAVKELDAKAAKIGELEARLASVEKARQAEMASFTDRLSQLETQIAKLASTDSAAQPKVALADSR